MSSTGKEVRRTANRELRTASCELEPRQEFTFAVSLMTVEVGQHKNPKSLTYINPLHFALFLVPALNPARANMKPSIRQFCAHDSLFLCQNAKKSVSTALYG